MGCGSGRCLGDAKKSVREVCWRDREKRLDCQFKEPFDGGMGMGEKVWCPAMQCASPVRVLHSSKIERTGAMTEMRRNSACESDRKREQPVHLKICEWLRVSEPHRQLRVLIELVVAQIARSGDV